MRVRHTLKIINWGAAATAVGILVAGKDRDYAWIGIVALAALFLHFLIETVVLVKRGRFKRRLADVSEFKEHRQFQVKDLESALSADALLAGVSLPVILDGALSGGQEKKAPLSGRKALAYRVVAEPLEVLGRVGGQVLLVDSYWGDMSLRDQTGAVLLTGPGVLDGSSLTERVYTLKNLKAELPELASRVEDGLGLSSSKEEKVRVAMREIALLPSDKVRVYGKAERSSGRLRISGSDTLDDAGSLMVRAAVSPASSRIPRRTILAIGLGAVSLCLLAGLVALASTTVIPGMFKPGRIFDATRTGRIRLDLDGRRLRVGIGSSHWDLRQEDMTRGFALSAGDTDFQASRDSRVTVQGVSGTVRTITAGDSDYPRWDGASWQFEAGPGAQVSLPGMAAARSGRVYVRNLTHTPVAIRILGTDGTPRMDTRWSFAALEGAADPAGSYLTFDDRPVAAATGDRLELIVKDGSRRILPLAGTAKWQRGSWLLELVPEFLAGSGTLWVRNRGDAPVRIWIIGADGKTLYGDEPWVFEPGEGSAANKGLKLQYNDKDIPLTGRESLKIETESLTTLYDGALERIAAWHRGTWTVDLSKARK
jgi:hypothetical protein